MSSSDSAETTRVTDKGQTTIPQELREKFGIEPGDEVVWTEGDESLTLRKKADLPHYGIAAEGMTNEEAELVAEELVEEMNELQKPDIDR